MCQVMRAGRLQQGPKLSTANGRVPHRKRPPVAGSLGIHVTWKVLKGVPSLRQERVIEELEVCFIAAKERHKMSLFGYTVMGNHVHLIVGAGDGEALSTGLKKPGGIQTP